MDYVIDTHTLIWYFTNSPRLGSNALSAIENTINEGLIIVPVIVLSEIMYLARKNKIPVSFQETLSKLEGFENFDIAGLDVDILRTADGIAADLEMHDKLIIATAIYLQADALLTKDEEIKASGLVPVIW